MAWSTFASINPSAFVTAGAVALWVGLLNHRDKADVSRDWLVAIGWAALVLPRRDGLIWACLTLAIALAATDRSAIDWWRWLRSSPRVVIGVSTLVTVVWGATSGSRTSQMVAFAPLIIVGAEAVRWWLARPDLTPSTKWIGVGGLSALGMAAMAALLAGRPGGWDTDLAVDVVAQTDDNLVEAIGVLGWLDTPVPWVAVYMWLMLVGALIAVALLSGLRTLGWATLLVATTVLTSWVFELYQGNQTATYWQGRYSIPLLVGVPILLTLDAARAADVAGPFLRRINLLVGAGARLDPQHRGLVGGTPIRGRNTRVPPALAVGPRDPADSTDRAVDRPCHPDDRGADVGHRRASRVRRCRRPIACSRCPLQRPQATLSFGSRTCPNGSDCSTSATNR